MGFGLGWVPVGSSSGKRCGNARRNDYAIYMTQMLCSDYCDGSTYHCTPPSCWSLPRGPDEGGGPGEVAAERRQWSGMGCLGIKGIFLEKDA